MRKYFHLLIALFAISFLPTIIANAQDNEGKTISLVVSGEGTTKEEATKNALRSAIEQAFGTFVSANTNVLNDELVKDEIVTVSSGNIQSYKEISYLDKGEFKEISLQTVVSIGKLVSYAQNKGMTTELAGATFAMNKKMRLLNKQNELSAMKHLCEQLNEISLRGLFDYKIVTSDPRSTGADRTEGSGLTGYNIIDITIMPTLNSNGYEFYYLIHSTLSALQLTKEEIEEYKSANEKYYQINSCDHEHAFWEQEMTTYNVRNDYKYLIGGKINGNTTSIKIFTLPISHYINRSLYGFKIIDNLGNEFSIDYIEDEGFEYRRNENSVSTARVDLRGGMHASLNEYSERYSRNPNPQKTHFGKGMDYWADVNGELHLYWLSAPGVDDNRTQDFWRNNVLSINGHLPSYNADALNDRVHGACYVDWRKLEDLKIEVIACYSDENLMNLSSIDVVPTK